MSGTKIRSAKDLERFRKQAAEDQSRFAARVLICMTGCRALGAADVADAFRKKLKSASLENQIAVVEVGCIGICARAPVVLIEPYDYLYGGVKPDHVDEIIETTLRNGQPVLSLTCGQNGQQQAKIDQVSFYRKQKLIVLENCGRIDPRRIDNGIARGAYKVVVDTLGSVTPENVIEQITASGLRGRGGAGFPTGVKWRFCRKAAGDEKYLICNADEGDPGAFMDRALLEGDPHRVIEGMIIAAYAIGAPYGFIYVRAEYPIAVEHIDIALTQARSMGLLGKNIAGTGFSFDIEVRMGAGAFVCGEETALIASLAGKRGMPTPRPPFPAESGYQGKPTNINNVETFANIAPILRDGPQAYARIGTDDSKGTKVFALAGKVKNTGLVEVPMGTTLREIIYEIGGGILDDRAFKAAQMGGPSGGCVPSQFLDLPVDYDSLKQIGAIMGSGGLIVMDESTCIVDLAKFFLTFVTSESCGKCVPCRVGTKRMLEILDRITSGQGRIADLSTLEQLAQKIQAASLCGLGQTAPNPVLSTIRYFRDEYEAHISENRCPAGVCKALIRYTIVEDKCVGCGACRLKCPVEAITGQKKSVHLIDPIKCIKCGVCDEVCKFEAIKVG